jgi:hypothetical protein
MRPHGTSGDRQRRERDLLLAVGVVRAEAALLVDGGSAQLRQLEM